MSERPIATDALATLGTIHTAPQHRDAIHLAVEPVTAGERLSPGEHIRIENGVAFGTEEGMGLGIVDPFLTNAVKKGQPFWFVMYPRQVHSLRHVWTHPAFDDVAVALVLPPEPKEVAMAWIANFAAKIDKTSNALMRAADNYHESGGDDWEYDNSEAYKSADTEEWKTFWGHWGVLTGKTPIADSYAPFSCSC